MKKDENEYFPEKNILCTHYNNKVETRIGKDALKEQSKLVGKIMTKICRGSFLTCLSILRLSGCKKLRDAVASIASTSCIGMTVVSNSQMEGFAAFWL